MTVNKFEYADTIKFDEQQYVEAYMELTRINRPFRLVARCLIAFAMLFWSYTMIIAICYFAFLLFAVLIPPRIMPGHMNQSFKGNRFARQETIYTADQSGFTIKTKGFRSKVSWDNAVFWQLTRNWLHIQTRGFPNAWFRVSELKRTGVYDCLMETLLEHGVKRG